MGRVRKSHNFHLMSVNKPTAMVWCFKCDNQKVHPGKKCQKCGARCFVASPKKYKNKLVEIRLIEAAKEKGDIL